MKKLMLIIAVMLAMNACTNKSEEKADGLKNETMEQEEVLSAGLLVAESEKCTEGHPEGHLCITPVASRVSKYSMDGKPEKAIEVLLVAKDIPGYDWDKKKLYESIIYLYDRTAQYEKNLDIWREGHEKGIIFGMDTTKTHFKPYLKLEGFTDIYNYDNRMTLGQ